ncbi:DJ-1/PfpI/YhbO family deglycase/protease [Erythrobacter sp. JK5]|uniref:DJ-1/PfpI/YhbO family deglycase/protease n=1 Tax=Erythrobacter sp. JK5 TaxID=2829500 RepID=UPI001BA587B8|nr:type 1 glutamine amidotransferase domain-containing protein [Erythrobacter sp. JK5]QUL36467.1 type 1 glutamine amidotransferase [Erythrobacter sp. JK5]
MKRILIIATDGFEQSELMKPKALLEEANAQITVASLEDGSIKGWNQGEWGDSVAVDKTVDSVNEGDFDALLLPGGQINPDVLRMNDRVIELVRDFNSANKPIAAICHAPWLLAEADIIAGKVVTGWPSIRTDLRNAGGEVVDKTVAVDGNIITSRNPDDIPAFTATLMSALAMDKVTESA